MTQTPARGATLRTITFATLLVLMIGYILIVGQGLILPILLALISVYILSAADAALANTPVIKVLPSFARRIILLLVFVGLVALFTALVISTVRQLVAEAPTYQENLENLIAEVTRLLGFSNVPDWATIQETLLGQISIAEMLNAVWAQLSSIGGTLFLVLIYASFLFGERAGFGAKMRLAIRDREHADHTLELIGEINDRIGQYLGTKTLINVILGLVSYVIMWAFGLDYAPFWALLIGLFNYIPYVGAIVALLFPLLLSVVQFASLPMTIGLFIALELAQIAVGNFLEPSMVGKRVNLSPFVVIVALALWSAIWGIIGAILAVPLTAMLVIIFYEIPATRGLAVMMSQNAKALGKKSNDNDTEGASQRA